MIILGLGSNIGDRLGFLRAAKRGLSACMSEITCSPVYESAALLPKGAPLEWNIAFYNMALRAETGLRPHELLSAVKAIERSLGRRDRGHWGPREIDIDILVYGDEMIATPELTIPHAGLLERDFALVPLADVAPGWRWQGKTASELAAPLRGCLKQGPDID